MLFRVLTFAVFLFAQSASAAELSPFTLSPSDADLLKQGDAVVKVWRDKARDDKAIDVFGAIDIPAPQNIVWDIMTDCARTETIVPRMKSCEVVDAAPDESWDIREQKSKVNFMITHTSRFRSDYVDGNKILIENAGGDMKIQQGIWELIILSPTLTRLRYRAATAPSFPVATSRLIKGSQESLPVILNNLREAAKADYLDLIDADSR